MTVSIEGREVIGIYLLLKRNEARLDKTLASTMARLERTLYQELSVEEFERLEEEYLRQSDARK